MIVAALNEEGQDNPQPRAQMDLAAKKPLPPKLSLIVLSLPSRFIFAAFNVSMDFLAQDHSKWENDTSFQSSHQVIWRLTAANDFAERELALIQDYNQILMKDEEYNASTSCKLLSGIGISFLMQKRQGPNSNMTLHNWLFIGPLLLMYEY